MQSKNPALRSVLNGTDGWPVLKDDKAFFDAMGRRIASARKALGLTQTELAQRLGCSQQIVAHYENGARRVPASVLPKLADILSSSVEQLMGIRTTPAKRSPSSRIQRQLEQIKTLPRSKQKAIMDMIDGVLTHHHTA